MCLHTYYNQQIIRFVLFIPKNLWPSKQWVKYLFDFVKSSLSLKDPINARLRQLKQLDEWNSYNKHYWPNSKWNKISYILKIIYIKIRECAHYGLYPRFMFLTGLMSVRISLNVIVMHTWNIAESSRIGIWKAYFSCLKITQDVRNFTFFVWGFPKLVPLCNHCLHILL